MDLGNDASLPRTRAHALAFYLPQYHPIAENDDWWGPGFTEWTNVAAARPLYRRHEQPNLPGELGFYDLRLPETRAEQARLAQMHGIAAFCYWHYWFAGRRILNRVFDEVLSQETPEMPFALAWANQTWTGIWHGAENRILIEQTYPGMDDHKRHFEYLLTAFCDKRYWRVDGKPLFYIYEPNLVPELPRVLDLWRNLASAAGLPGMYLVGESKSGRYYTQREVQAKGLDAICNVRMPPAFNGSGFRANAKRIKGRFSGANTGLWHGPTRWPIESAHPEHMLQTAGNGWSHPSVIPNWDNTPRSGQRGRVLTGATPETYGRHLSAAARAVESKAPNERLIFIKSWNEWAEGNYLEPDRTHGREWLRQTLSALTP